MIIAFETKALRDTCEDDDAAVKQLGPSLAASLQQTLADLRAAGSIGELVVGDPQIGGENGAALTVSLTDGARLMFVANHVDPPVTVDGMVDWSSTNRVRLTQIEVDSS
jgi:hypothetical protein